MATVGAMQYWLVKQEPEAYSWDDFLRDKKTIWDGVRNYQARNNLKTMVVGDPVLFYHSVGPRKVVGVAEVTGGPFPEPGANDDRWISVELKPVRTLKTPVSLDAIKADPELSDIALIRQSRLSVMPLKKEEFERILEMSA